MYVKLGAIFMPEQPPIRLRSVARMADSAGLEELWLWENCFAQGGVSALTAALAWTEHVRIGVGVLPVPLRNVALAAMEISTIDSMFGTRAIWGLGHGVQNWMAQAGADVSSPLTLLSEYVGALRALLSGEPCTVAGRYVQLSDVAMETQCQRPTELHLAATGPRTLELAAGIADGVILKSSASANDVRAAAKILTAPKAEPPSGVGIPITATLKIATGADSADRLVADMLRMGRRSVLNHAGVESDDGVGVAGDAEAIANGVLRLVEAGANSVTLEPTADADPVDFVEFVAGTLQPMFS